jgi:HAE1 family hydrophobic/amphiphilic exporter-1
VQQLGLTVKKVASDYLIVPHLFSPDGSRDQLYLSNYATLHIKDAIARLDGVGDVQTFGARDYAMRIWLDPAKVAADDLQTSRSQESAEPGTQLRNRLWIKALYDCCWRCESVGSANR